MASGLTGNEVPLDRGCGFDSRALRFFSQIFRIMRNNLRLRKTAHRILKTIPCLIINKERKRGS